MEIPPRPPIRAFVRAARRQPDRFPADLVRSRVMSERCGFPLLVEPGVPDMDVSAWCDAHRQLVDRWLLEHRAVLFRGFEVASAERLEELVAMTSSGGRMECPDESTPRAAVADRIYESTVYPAHEAIQLHNEASYCDAWPRKIYFCCIRPARERGATPLADVRRVASRIPPGVLEQFAVHGVAYVRNFNDEGIGLSWQKAFWTDDPRKVEAYCRDNDIRYQWKSGGGLRTTTVRPAFRRHPQSGEMLWFNHAVFFNSAAYSEEMRGALIAALGRENLPFESYFGDGRPIDPGIVRGILDVYDQEKVSFSWERGDVLLLDNMTIAHGRESFAGDRTVIVAMAEPQGGAMTRERQSGAAPPAMGTQGPAAAPE